MIKNEVILSTATKVLSERPNATLQTIAREAGISRTTIFNRYPTREALLAALCSNALQQINDAVSFLATSTSTHFSHDLQKLTELLIPLAPQSTFLRNTPTQQGNLDALWEQTLNPLSLYMAEAQTQGLLRKEIPIRWLVTSYLSLLFGAWDEISLGELGPAQAARFVVLTWIQGAGQTAK